MANPLVSFIIPYYNAGSTIQETIDSIFNQSYSNFDIWLINDGTTDKFSIDKLKDFEGNSKINIIHQENLGPSSARNNGILKSEADYIIFLDSDDKITINGLVDSLELMKQNPNVGVIYGNLQFFDEVTKIQIQEDFKLEKQLIWNQIAVCCLVRKSVIDDVGLFDEYLSKLGLEDWEFWIRVAVSDWEFKKIEQVHFQIRIVSFSRTFEVANKNISEIKEYIFKKHYRTYLDEYTRLFYEKKMLLETPDFKIGIFILAPYRFLKKKYLRIYKPFIKLFKK